MNPALAVALNTFRETIRARILYATIVFGLLTLGTATVVSPLALGETERITKDVGLAAIDVLGLLIITLLGTTMIHREIEQRTILMLLARPIHRFEFVLGKFLGLSLTLALAVAVQTACLMAALLVVGGADLRVLWGALMALIALLTMNAVAVLFTGIAGPVVAAVLTVGCFVAGRLAGDLVDFATTFGVPLVGYVFYLLPNLASMSVRPEIVHGMALEPARLALAIGHGVSYAAGALLVAGLVFRGREFR